VSVRFSLRRNNKAPAPGSPDDTSADAGSSGTPSEYKGALRYRVRSQSNSSGASESASAPALNRAYDHTHEVRPVGYPAADVDQGATEGGYVGAPELYGPDPTVMETVYEPEPYVGDYGDDESWLAPDTRRRIKLAIPTFALGALVVIAGAFWGGAEVDKHFGANNTTSAGSLAAALGGRGATGSGGTGRGAFAGLGGGGGGGGGFGSTPAASGTLSAISGHDLTVTTTTGSKVKVVLVSSTTVISIGQGSTGGLKVGDTVRVQGTTGSGGTIKASSITATAAGVTTGGGFAGLGGGGGGGFGGTGATGAGTGVGGGSTGGSSTQPTVKNGGFSGDGSGVSGG
jgi:hypothetical protein